MKTDTGKIQYPAGLSASERRHCRRIIVAIAEFLRVQDEVIVACSGGIDSSVLAHATGQAMLILGEGATHARTSAVYLNHHLRPEAVEAEAKHVESLAAQYLSYVTPSISLDVPHGKSLEERARKARYIALSTLTAKMVADKPDIKVTVFTAHNMNDDAETKLFQFMRGRKEQPGIPTIRKLDSDPNVVLVRPLLNFSRKDIERYAKCFNLTWFEDASNATDAHTRNKIRHHMIPWIEGNVNPGFVNMLNKLRRRGEK